MAFTPFKSFSGQVTPAVPQAYVPAVRQPEPVDISDVFDQLSNLGKVAQNVSRSALELILRSREEDRKIDSDNAANELASELQQVNTNFLINSDTTASRDHQEFYSNYMNKYGLRTAAHKDRGSRIDAIAQKWAGDDDRNFESIVARLSSMGNANFSTAMSIHNSLRVKVRDAAIGTAFESIKKNFQENHAFIYLGDESEKEKSGKYSELLKKAKDELETELGLWTSLTKEVKDNYLKRFDYETADIQFEMEFKHMTPHELSKLAETTKVVKEPPHEGQTPHERQTVRFRKLIGNASAATVGKFLQDRIIYKKEEKKQFLKGKLGLKLLNNPLFLKILYTYDEAEKKFTEPSELPKTGDNSEFNNLSRKEISEIAKPYLKLFYSSAPTDKIKKIHKALAHRSDVYLEKALGGFSKIKAGLLTRKEEKAFLQETVNFLGENNGTEAPWEEKGLESMLLRYYPIDYYHYKNRTKLLTEIKAIAITLFNYHKNKVDVSSETVRKLAKQMQKIKSIKDWGFTEKAQGYIDDIWTHLKALEAKAENRVDVYGAFRGQKSK